jgi:hypothetical protein
LHQLSKSPRPLSVRSLRLRSLSIRTPHPGRRRRPGSRHFRGCGRRSASRSQPSASGCRRLPFLGRERSAEGRGPQRPLASRWPSSAFRGWSPAFRGGAWHREGGGCAPGGGGGIPGAAVRSLGMPPGISKKVAGNLGRYVFVVRRRPRARRTKAPLWRGITRKKEGLPERSADHSLRSGPRRRGKEPRRCARKVLSGP